MRSFLQIIHNRFSQILEPWEVVRGSEVQDSYINWVTAFTPERGLSNKEEKLWWKLTRCDNMQLGDRKLPRIYANRIRAMSGPYGKEVCKMLTLRVLQKHKHDTAVEDLIKLTRSRKQHAQDHM